VFDIGFSEMLVIAVVALIVIGPERMPGVARTAGALFGRAQRCVTKLKADIRREVDLDEMKRIKAAYYEAAKSIDYSVAQARDELGAAAKSMNESIAAPSPGPATTVIEAPSVPMNMDFGLDSVPVAGPAATPNI
jgi:sec-independent protein translocase protein TatB